MGRADNRRIGNFVPPLFRPAARPGGYYLRTKLTAAIGFLDQLYRYGEAGSTRINQLGQETFEEDVPSLEALGSQE